MGLSFGLVIAQVRNSDLDIFYLHQEVKTVIEIYKLSSSVSSPLLFP